MISNAKKSVAVTESDAFSVPFLRSVSDNQLLPCLFTAARALRAASTTPHSVTEEYVEFLLSPRFLKHAYAIVRQLVSCLLCDIARLGTHTTVPGAQKTAHSATSSSLPFSDSVCDDVLACVMFPFAEVTRTRSSLRQCALLVEAASASHMLARLLPRCRARDATTLCIQPLFDAVAFANGSSAPGSARSGQGTRSSVSHTTPSATGAESGEISTSAVPEMVRMLSDVLAATQVLTTDQLHPLLHELVQASPALRRAGLLTGNGASALFTAASAVQTPPGARIASRFFAEHMEALTGAISRYAMGFVETGVQEVVAAEIASTDFGGTSSGVSTTMASTSAALASAAEEKRGGLRQLAKGMEVAVVMTELDVTLVSELIPALLPFLQHESPDVRLVVFRGLSAALMASEAFPVAYRTAVASLLALFYDTKPAVRLEAVQAARAWIDGCVTLKWSHSRAEQLWRALQPVLERALTDSHVLVRTQAVMSTAHAALVAPSVVIGADAAPAVAAAAAAGGAAAPSSGSSFLARSLGLRTADKNAKVRKTAVACLCKLYREQLLSWVPDAVMNAVNAESGLALVVCHVEQLLPPPTKTSRPRGSEPMDTGADADTGLPPSQRGSLSATAASMALFDFEKEELREERGYVDALVQLCADMSPHHFGTLVSIMRKKPQLRTAVARLFELRDAIKQKEDPKAQEGQQIIHNIHRLLEFLQGVTHAEKGEWDALFRSKDDRISKAFLQIFGDEAQSRCVDWFGERKALLEVLKGRLDTNTSAFVCGTLVPMLIFPVQLTHLEALLAQLEAVLTSVKAETGKAADESQHQRALGLLRALLVLLVSAPGLHTYASNALMKTVTVTVEALQHVGGGLHVSGGKSPLPQSSRSSFLDRGQCCLLAMNCLKEWASFASAAGDLADYGTAPTAGKPPHHAQRPTSASVSSFSSSASPTTSSSASMGPIARHPLAGVTEAMKNSVLTALATLCQGLVAHDADAHTAHASKKKHGASGKRGAHVSFAGTPATTTTSASSSAATIHAELVMATHLSKQAARCFAALLGVSTFGNGADLTALLNALVTEVAQRERDDDDAAPNPRRACQLSAVRVFLQEKSYQALLPWSTLESAFAHAFLTAIRPCGASATATTATRHDVDALKTKTFFASSEALPGLVLPFTPHTIVIDKAAKALVALALSQPADRRPGTTARVLDALLQGYKRSCEVPTKAGGDGNDSPAATAAQLSTVGGCQTRLAIDKQLAKLLVSPSNDIGKELAVSVLLSAEGEDCVREPVQKKLLSLITSAESRADMRYVALLLLTAMSEDSRQGYQSLRTLVHAAGDHFRARQAASGASLSSPQALFCFTEYTIPFLVLFQAHHTFYESESASHFTAYQRVWHLLFDELFRFGTQCSSFVSELLSRIKQADDVLDRSSDRHRVLCDLASRIMLECLGQRQTGVESAKRYPGVVLLPTFFSKSGKQNSQTTLSTVFLDPSTHIFANAPFRAPTVAAAGGTTRTTMTTTGGDARTRGAAQDASDEAAEASKSPSLTPRVSPGRGVVGSTRAGHRHHRGVAAVADADTADGDKRADEQGMEAVEREVTPYGQLATPGSASRKRPSRSPQHNVSPAAAAKQRRVQSGQRDGARAAVEAALTELVSGLSKGEIAAMRWKAVRARVEEALDSAQGVNEEATPDQRDALMTHAKELLKKHYADAPV